MRRWLVAMLILAAAMAMASGAHAASTDQPVAQYQDLLDFHGTPRTAADRSFNIFFDMGAWQGYSLPRVGDAGTGFSGPFVHSLGTGQWAGVRFAALALRDVDGRGDVDLK